jgi:hypothetical protein
MPRFRKVLNPNTGRYVYKHGEVANNLKCSRSRSRRSRKSISLNERSLVQRSRNQKVRRSPSASATLFASGITQEGNDGQLWKIKIVSGGIHRWMRA